MFPIGWMYYFGTNLENKFDVPGFWPRPEESHRIPHDKDELKEELVRLRAQTVENRRRRRREAEVAALEMNKMGGNGGGEGDDEQKAEQFKRLKQ